MTFLSIFGSLGVGAVIGLLSYLVFRKRGISFVPSVIVGGISGTVGGIIPVLFGLAGAPIYAGVASLATLITFNAFRKKGEPIFEEA